MDVMITSVCPAVVRLVRSKYPKLAKYLLPVLSPMQTHAKYLKEKNRDCIPVYISPCISPVAEISEKNNYSAYVISFEELDSWMEESGIRVEHKQEEPTPKLSRMRAMSGGITRIIRKNEDYTYLSIDGVENCMQVLDELQEGKIHKCFLELNICEGGCIGGPSFQKDKRRRMKSSIDVMAASMKDPFRPEDEADFNLPMDLNLEREFIEKEVTHPNPTEEELQEILKKMGKATHQKELNCGACGYPTCREKAIAVCQKKAELNMCIPYHFDRARSMSHLVMETSPNIIMVIDEDLKILECSAATEKYFGI